MGMANSNFSATVAAAARNTLCPTLPFCNYLSPPLVSNYGAGASLSFLIGRGEVLHPDVGYQIWPPCLLAIFDAQTGFFQELRAIKPAEFGCRDDPDAPLGAGTLPAQQQQPAYIDKQIRLFEACDRLLNTMVGQEPTDEIKKNYWDALTALIDPPLRAYAEPLLVQSIRLAARISSTGKRRKG
jgi:hypothetical protein